MRRRALGTGTPRGAGRTRQPNLDLTWPWNESLANLDNLPAKEGPRLGLAPGRLDVVETLRAMPI